jgi:hypothetical protein
VPNLTFNQWQDVFQFLKRISKHLEKATWFASVDAFKVFLQFPLSQESQKIYCFLTKLGAFNPTRLIQGSAHVFQAVLMDVFEDLLYICVLVWIKDVLV